MHFESREQEIILSLQDQHDVRLQVNCLPFDCAPDLLEDVEAELSLTEMALERLDSEEFAPDETGLAKMEYERLYGTQDNLQAMLSELGSLMIDDLINSVPGAQPPVR